MSLVALGCLAALLSGRLGDRGRGEAAGRAAVFLSLGLGFFVANAALALGAPLFVGGLFPGMA
jgi:hypothetical protein